MIAIRRAKEEDFKLVADMGKTAFIESHGHSADKNTIAVYVAEKFNYEKIKEELGLTINYYHILFHNDEPAGYSKIVLDASHPNIRKESVTLLERIYLLNQFHGKNLGSALFQFNLTLSKKNRQAGMWLFVWKENQTAIRFYTKNHFKVIGSGDFYLSATHANPNYQMFLEY